MRLLQVDCLGLGILNKIVFDMYRKDDKLDDILLFAITHSAKQVHENAAEITVV